MIEKPNPLYAVLALLLANLVAAIPGRLAARTPAAPLLTHPGKPIPWLSAAREIPFCSAGLVPGRLRP